MFGTNNRVKMRTINLLVGVGSPRVLISPLMHQHLAVFFRLDVFLTYSLTVSLVSERRPAPTSEVDDRGSRASLLPLAG